MPITAKLPCCTMGCGSIGQRNNRAPCVAEQKHLHPGKENTEIHGSLWYVVGQPGSYTSAKRILLNSMQFTKTLTVSHTRNSRKCFLTRQLMFKTSCCFQTFLIWVVYVLLHLFTYIFYIAPLSTDISWMFYTNCYRTPGGYTYVNSVDGNPVFHSLWYAKMVKYWYISYNIYINIYHEYISYTNIL